MFTERMHRVVQLLERVFIGLLLVMAALAIVEVGFELYAAATGPGFLILAIGVTWYLLKRSGASPLQPTE